MRDLRWPLVVLLVVAVVLRSELFFAVLYLVLMLQLLIWFWQRRVARRLQWRRVVPPAAFPGEAVPVRLEITNPSLLPLPWLAIDESVPVGLRTPPQVREVITLDAVETRTLHYELVPRRRGYYPVGPLFLETGDVLGLATRRLGGLVPTMLTVYPRVVPLAPPGLPAALPFGSLAAPRRLFTDPARPVGVRAYQAGDAVRRIDWKSSARLGVPQVRRSEPAIALETLLVVAFDRAAYPGRLALETRERVLVAAASLVAHLAALRQPVGLWSNGVDPLFAAAPRIPPGNGRNHLLLVLGALGRLEAADGPASAGVLAQAAQTLSWGGTLVLLTGACDAGSLASLVAARRRGIHPAAIVADAPTAALIQLRRHHIRAYTIDRDGRPGSAGVDNVVHA